METYAYRYPREQWLETFTTLLKGTLEARRDYAEGLQNFLGKWMRSKMALHGEGRSFALEQFDKAARLQGQSPENYMVYLFGQPTPQAWMKEFIACADFNFEGSRALAAVAA